MEGDNGLCYELGLFNLVIRTAELYGVSFSRLGPEILSFALCVVGNDTVCRIQYSACGAVVLLKFYLPYLGEILLELHYVLIIGTPPGVDGLVVVSHHADITALLCQQIDKIVLDSGGVLEFIHHYIPVTLPVFFKHLWLLIEKLYREHYKIVKIHCVVELEEFIVLNVDRAEQPVVWSPFLPPCLYAGKKVCQVIEIQVVRVSLQGAGCLLYKGHLVILVIDAEILLESQMLYALPEDLDSKGVECGDCEHGELPSYQTFYSVLHLPGRLVGECQGQDRRLGNPLVQHVCDTVGYSPGLSRPGPCYY